MDSEDCYATGMGEDEMIRIDKCVKDPTCVMLTLNGFVSLMTEEDQKIFLDWRKANKPELF